MTGRLLPFDASTHAAVDALLPFYVNATLQGEELSLVEQHVHSCEKCQRELDWLRHIFADLTNSSLRLDATLNAVGSPQRPEDDQIRRRWRMRIQDGLRHSTPWTRWLLAAQLAAIVILATLVATDVRDNASYRTLGTPSPSAQLQDLVAVVFDPSTPESQLRQIVSSIGARIVDGPTVTGAFVLEVPKERVPEALKTLRAERAVRLAEDLGARSGR
jgi:hypothetical protein